MVAVLLLDSRQQCNVQTVMQQWNSAACAPDVGCIKRQQPARQLALRSWTDGVQCGAFQALNVVLSDGGREHGGIVAQGWPTLAPAMTKADAAPPSDQHQAAPPVMPAASGRNKLSDEPTNREAQP